MADSMEKLKLFRSLVEELYDSADLREAQNRHHDSSRQQHTHLHEIRPGCGLQTAVDRIPSGENSKNENAPDNIQAEHRLERYAGCEQGPRDNRHDVAEHKKTGEG